ncbi:MAG: GNAT family N-acetyltransferase [Aureliella sp.]
MNQEKYEISTDRNRLDIHLIHDFLSNSYWAQGIERNQVEDSIAGSLCFGVYCGERQIGFARVITDGVTFGYLADVFVVEPYRNQGVGRLLTQNIVEHPRLRELRRLLLFTVDAHHLYAKFGFVPVEGSKHAMQIYRGAILDSAASGKGAKILPPSAEIVPYKPRATRMIDVQEIEGWNLKLYSIHAADEELTSGVVEAAIRYAAQEVPWPADRATPYGFITIHQGEQAVWLLVDLWVRDILHHFVYCSSPSNPTQFQLGPQDGTTACVWELEVTRHERDAWVNHVLSDPACPAYGDYLAASFEIHP